MEIKSGFHLGISGTTFILWNATKLINLTAKNLQSAIKAELIIKNK